MKGSNLTAVPKNESNARERSTNQRYKKLIARLQRHKEFRNDFNEDMPYGLFGGRPIIAGSSKIRGGIHPGAKAREAIVIDEIHGALYPVYMELLVAHVKKYGKTQPTEDTIFPLMQRLINKHISLQPEHVSTLHAQRRMTPDQKVALDLYVRVGYGAERHQVLLAAYLIEKLIERGLLTGTMYLDVSLDENGEEVERILYTSSDGRLITYDPRLARNHFTGKSTLMAA